MDENKDQSNALSLQEGLEKAGYRLHFAFHDGGIWDSASGRKFQPQDLSIEGVFRFEGASDPENMSIIYALQVNGGERGLLMDAFGVYGDAELEEFMRRVEDRRPRSVAAQVSIGNEAGPGDPDS